MLNAGTAPCVLAGPLCAGSGMGCMQRHPTNFNPLQPLSHLLCTHCTLMPQVLVSDNLELGCTIIERAATDKAVRDIDKSLAPGYDARAKARQVGTNFYEMALHYQVGGRLAHWGAGGPGLGRQAWGRWRVQELIGRGASLAKCSAG